MTEQELHKLMEVQYLKGRIDELHKAFPTITNIDRSRKLDMRLSKYYEKLKNTSEEAYHLYLVERVNNKISKEKSKQFMKDLLEELVPYIQDEELLQKLSKQINKY
jgi:polyhydroxyalkanoate synthesis regulator phasin